MIKKILEEKLEKRGELRRYLPDFKKFRLDFSSNDYLGFSETVFALDYSFGASGSRLLSGNHEIFERFEKQIAIDKNQEEALLFSSGYLANLTTLSTLIDLTQPVVFFDRLNHASLYDALKLSHKHAYRYQNINHLEKLLKEHASDKNIIVSETLFGMDGHCADMASLISLSHRFKALLYLDEAHATGVLGEKGYGISTDYDLENLDCIVMGTLSKGLGCSGAYIACSKLIKEIIINFGRGFIYTTAPSPATMEAAYHFWKKLPFFHSERQFLKDLGCFAREKFQEIGLDTGRSETHIIPLLMESNDQAFYLFEKFKEKDISLSYVRYPTVPTPRLRMALTIKHTKNNILEISDILKDCL